MLEFYLQRVIHLQLIKLMGMGEKTHKKNKIEQKKNPFGYRPTPTVFRYPWGPKTSRTFPKGSANGKK